MLRTDARMYYVCLRDNIRISRRLDKWSRMHAHRSLTHTAEWHYIILFVCPAWDNPSLQTFTQYLPRRGQVPSQNGKWHFIAVLLLLVKQNKNSLRWVVFERQKIRVRVISGINQNECREIYWKYKIGFREKMENLAWENVKNWTIKKWLKVILRKS